MKREVATKKLERMLEAIEAGQVPVNVREFYVFGSYARGAPEPKDLDLLLFYDGDESLRDRIYRDLEAQGFSSLEIVRKGAQRFLTEIKRSLCRPGEQIDLGIERHDPSGSNRFRNDRIEQEKILLWSQEDHDWRTKLAAVRPDPMAGHYERGHFFPLRRLHASLVEMNAVIELLAADQLVLTKIPVDKIDPKISSAHQHWVDHWSACRAFGKNTFKLLTWAFWWLEQHHQRYDRQKYPQVGPGYIATKTHLVLMGRPSLCEMQAALRRGKDRVCLIPHLKKAGPNELLVFERGPNWKPD